MTEFDFLNRRFSKENESPYDSIEWEFRTALIGDPDDPVFEQQGVEVPSFWSQNATNVVAQKYFAYNQSDPRRETSVKQLINRVAGKIAKEGRKNGYFDSDQAESVFYDELRYILVHQLAAFNSPVWFNMGVEGVKQTGSACFILSVEDNLKSISRWYAEEMAIFQNGSGAGLNLSKLRGSGEELSRGGVSSGPVTFMRAADASAGTIQSGGRCLAPDQYVYTENGPVKVKELAEREEFICISYDPPSNRYKMKWAQAWKSGEKELIEIVTDKGKFKMSSDHPVRLSDGKVLKAGELKEGYSMFSGSIRERADGYLEIGIRDGQGSKTMLHRLIAEDILKENIKGLAVHHKDSNKKNNALSNLEIIHQKEHAKIHNQALVEKGVHHFQLNKYPKKGINNPMHSESAFWTDSSAVEKYKKKQSKVMLEKRDPKALQIQAGNQRMINLAFKIINKGGNIDTFENYCKSRKELIGDYGISKKKLKERFIKRFGSYESFVKEVRSQNHKVVAINPIGKSTVYDVEVFCTTPDDKTAKSGHNFIIWPDDNPTGSGIVVFNTRRAAKLVCLDIDHPDVEDFITCKAREEERVHALRAAGFEMGMSGIGERNMAEATAYQNANNSVRVTDQFMQAVLDDKEWQLIGRKDGKPVRTVQAKELMNLVADAAWRCADPGIQYDTTINDWHTTPANGPITGSNPCCFTGDTQVVTLEGRFTFEQLISRTYIGDHELPEVVGVDPQGKQVTQRIEKVWKAGETDKLVLVSTVRGTNLRCTPEHKFLNSDGDYVAAENLIRGDELVALQGNDQVASITKINLEQPVSVYDLEAPVTNNFPVAGANDQEAVIVHNSEYMSNDNTACNLASINLLKFLNEDGTFDTERFEHVTSIIFLAQEITISFADFPTPKIAKNTQALRQIGIGYTNLGALLMALAHPYDSDPGREIAGGVTALLTGQAYLTSAKIAAKIGPFADYEANKESTLRILNKHRKEANKLDSESYGTGVGKAAKAAWKKALADAKEYGVRNAQASVAAPTGCLIPSTLVATDRGLIRLGGLGDKHGDQWQDVDFQVQTDQGPKQATKFFINGEVEVARVKTKNGYEILGTPEHQIKIIDQNGDWVWTKIADVQAGSKLPLMLNNLIGNPREVDLSQITLSAEHGERRDNSIPMVQPPKAVTADLSELVGFYYGSQSNYLGSRVNILVDAQDQQLQTKISALIESLFSDRPVSTECFHDPSKIELSVPGQWADKWWHEAGFDNLRISPAKIRRTNNQEIYAAFLRGFWQAGRVDKIGLVVKTEEKELANDIRSMMLTVGIPTSTVLNDQNGKPEYEIRPLDAAVGKFTEKIGALTETRINNLKEIATLQKTSFGVEDFFEDEIVSAELAYKSETYDLSVPENVTYVANGIVSHNTISFLMDADTTGIEPDFSLIKHKTLAGGGSLQIVNRTVPEALRRMGLNQKQIDESIAYIEEEITREDGSQGPRGHLHGAKHVTENQARVFDCAVGEHAIDYHAHLKMMAAAQPFLSGAISKTVNLPADATVEDIAETYIEGWRLGLKSVAIYRDGSKANQPLAEKKADRDEEAQAAAEARVTSLLGDGLLRGERRRVPRDAEIKGVNFNIGPVGGYVHVRLFEDGTPGAVFVEVGQAGSTLNGFISVWAITMSLGLQYGLPLDKLASKLAWTQFEPQGFTDDPEIRSAKSIVDYVIRWMANEFLDLDDISREALGLGIQSKEADTGEHTIIPGGEIEPKAEVKAPVKPAEKHKVSIQRIGGHCSRCGSTDLFPTGSCMTCRSCGETSGCG